MNEWTVAPGGTGVDTISGDGARVTNASTASYGASYAIGSNPQATKTLNADGSVTYAITTNNHGVFRRGRHAQSSRPRLNTHTLFVVIA